MKRIFFIVLIVLTIVSCKKEEKVTDKLLVKDSYSNLYGNWVGDFVVIDVDTAALETDYVYANKITIVLKKIEKNKVYGQSVVAGNLRPLVGSFTESNGEYKFKLNEPGNNTTDGSFQFKIVSDTLSGFWFATNKKTTVQKRQYKLVKQVFIYNPKLMLPKEGDYIDYFSVKIDSVKYENEDGVEDTYFDDTYRSASDIITKLNASTTLLKESDVKNLKKLELEIIRNTIFARHGYSFKKKSFRQFFDPVDWYVPVTDDMSGKLTAIEQKNIVLLNRFQKYAEDNYDSFGR